MPLDLTHITDQIEQMSEAASGDDYLRHIAIGRELLRTVPPQELRDKYKLRRRNNVKMPWAEAYVLYTLADTFAAPPPPPNFGVAAADGSDIPPDRHSPARFSVINTGSVFLQYGDAPAAEMTTHARLLFAEEMWLLSDGVEDYIEKELEGPLLAARRAVEELAALWEVCQSRPMPVVALDDGQLILWPIQREPKPIRDQLIGPFIATLEKFRQAGIPVASYISFTNAKDIAYALRSWACQGAAIRCEVCDCPATLRGWSLELKHVRDRQLFDTLRPGERSDIFQPESPILADYGVHSIEFFYLNVGGEIARIEAPHWVMHDRALLDLVHAVIVDQCLRSVAYPPYPPILQEAHEQAVISTSDRRVIEQMVEEALQRQGQLYLRGAKDRSKRVRTV